MTRWFAEKVRASKALSTPGMRTSTHSAKAKGKKPEPLQPVADPEDEFELVMGVFEKVTHEHTEFLYQVLIYRCL